MEQPRIRRDNHVVPRIGGIGPRLAVAGDGRDDDARVPRMHLVVPEPELGELARHVVLDDDVGLADEALDDRAPGGRLEVEREAALAAVRREEVRRLGRKPVAAFRRRSREGRAPRARVVAAARMLDLDDVRAEVREEHRRVRAGQHAAQVEHAHAGQRRRDARRSGRGPGKRALHVARSVVIFSGSLGDREGGMPGMRVA